MARPKPIHPTKFPMSLRESEALLKAEDEKWRWLEDLKVIGIAGMGFGGILLALAALGYLGYVLLRGVLRIFG